MSELFYTVRSGLMTCRGTNNDTKCDLQCPYNTGKTSHCIDKLMDCALALIQRQKARIDELEAARMPRILTLDEITKHDGPVYVTWQDPESGCWAVCPPKEDIYRFREWDTLSFSGGPVNQPKMKYGKTWRCWTQQPTKEQREAVPWDE